MVTLADASSDFGKSAKAKLSNPSATGEPEDHYRRKSRERPIIGDRRPPSPLGDIQPDTWPAEYTTDLLNLLNVLGLLVDLEPAQAALLERICSGPLLDARALREQGLFDDPRSARLRSSESAHQPDMFPDAP